MIKEKDKQNKVPRKTRQKKFREGNPFFADMWEMGYPPEQWSIFKY
ncbi:unnamed protein product [marine sediment metagenome]|uniref:Uncharacterized protein n=1 Tax=marine sediment metagenome TaxID=412755 RepID=X1E802_9ZZZZ